MGNVKFLIAGTRIGMRLLEFSGFDFVKAQPVITIDLHQPQKPSQILALAVGKAHHQIYFVPYGNSLEILRFNPKSQTADGYRLKECEHNGKLGISWHNAIIYDDWYIATSTMQGVFVFDCKNLNFYQNITPNNFEYEWHLNGIRHIADNQFYLSCHNFASKKNRESFLIIAEWIDDKLVEVERQYVGVDLHCPIFIDDIGWIVCSSAKQRIIGIDNDVDIQTSKNSYPKQILYHDGCLYVACMTDMPSDIDNVDRYTRDCYPCWIEVFDFQSGIRKDIIDVALQGVIHEMVRVPQHWTFKRSYHLKRREV